MSRTAARLDELALEKPKFLQKGGLCVGLVMTRASKIAPFPLDPRKLRTKEGGQVLGLGRSAVQRILQDYSIIRVLAEEGGRTSRGTLGMMEDYVAVLNELDAAGQLDLDAAEQWWIDKVRKHFASEGPKFEFDPGRSVSANIDSLLDQALELQENSGGTNYLGAMLQHLVGAKMDIVLGTGKIGHQGFSVADHSTNRSGDFQVESLIIHVTTRPTEGLLRKCEINLREGLRPLIVTLKDGVAGAAFLLNGARMSDRVDVLDLAQFLTANICERSFFNPGEYKNTLLKLLRRYNEIVSSCEVDPALKIRIRSEDES